MKNIKFNNKENIAYDIDGKKIYNSRSCATVGVVICRYKNDDYVLIAERGIGSADYSGYWNIPCGYLDWDETGYEGVVREVYEETGFYIPSVKKVIRQDLNQPFFVNTDPKENRQNISLSYGIYFKTNKLPKLSKEHNEPDEVGELGWVKISELNKYKFAFNHLDRIKMYYSIIFH